MERQLFNACRQGNLSEVQSIVEKSGISVKNAKDSGCWTPLMCAAYTGHSPVVNFLLTLSPDLESTNQFKWTALHLAASRDHLEVVQGLLKAGANVHACDQDGHTALHAAATGAKVEVINSLLKAGANPLAINKHSETAADLARQFGIVEIAKLLESFTVERPKYSPPSATSKVSEKSQSIGEICVFYCFCRKRMQWVCKRRRIQILKETTIRDSQTGRTSRGVIITPLHKRARQKHLWTARTIPSFNAIDYLDFAVQSSSVAYWLEQFCLDHECSLYHPSCSVLLLCERIDEQQQGLPITRRISTNSIPPSPVQSKIKNSKTTDPVLRNSKTTDPPIAPNQILSKTTSSSRSIREEDHNDITDDSESLIDDDTLRPYVTSLPHDCRSQGVPWMLVDEICPVNANDIIAKYPTIERRDPKNDVDFIKLLHGFLSGRRPSYFVFKKNDRENFESFQHWVYLKSEGGVVVGRAGRCICRQGTGLAAQIHDDAIQPMIRRLSGEILAPMSPESAPSPTTDLYLTRSPSISPTDRSPAANLDGLFHEYGSAGARTLQKATLRDTHSEWMLEEDRASPHHSVGKTPSSISLGNRQNVVSQKRHQAQIDFLRGHECGRTCERLRLPKLEHADSGRVESTLATIEAVLKHETETRDRDRRHCTCIAKESEKCALM
eukprot:GHVL01007310.1.p1 GENE.GHVL01007310.1~~GHVL01007310.1.p1  ORF type:complete len:668 (-),score=108.26 GHVL01007310.1:2573-4576(-)